MADSDGGKKRNANEDDDDDDDLEPRPGTSSSSCRNVLALTSPDGHEEAPCRAEPILRIKWGGRRKWRPVTDDQRCRRRVTCPSRCHRSSSGNGLSSSARPSSSPSRLLVFMGLLLWWSSSATLVAGMRCYCTDEACVPYGVCEGERCMVGIVRHSNQVIRTCGRHALGCHRDDEHWTDLCVCDQPFCNTFAHLRAHTRHMTDMGFGAPPPPDDTLVFERVDRPDDSPFLSPMDAPISASGTSMLTLLLVGVPLCVGALTVLVVAFNYYCHLC